MFGKQQKSIVLAVSLLTLLGLVFFSSYVGVAQETPTKIPENTPTIKPTVKPTAIPTKIPENTPTIKPTIKPTITPTKTI